MVSRPSAVLTPRNLPSLLKAMHSTMPTLANSSAALPAETHAIPSPQTPVTVCEGHSCSAYAKRPATAGEGHASPASALSNSSAAIPAHCRLFVLSYASEQILAL